MNRSMKKTIFGLSVLTIAFSLFVACDKEAQEQNKDLIVNATDIGTFSATLTAKVTVDILYYYQPEGRFYISDSAKTLEELRVNNRVIQRLELSEDGSYSYALRDLDNNTTYYYVAEAFVNGSSYYSEVKSFTTKDISFSNEVVDMGFSVKWRAWNVGASKAEEFGDYFAWGEITPYYQSLSPLQWKSGKSDGFTWSSYKWCDGDEYKITKYKWMSTPTDGIYFLEETDDAAHAVLGGNWRTPTHEEWEELFKGSTLKYITYKGVKGAVIIGKNGNYIFLPAAGWWRGTEFLESGEAGKYWSSTLYSDRATHDESARCTGVSSESTHTSWTAKRPYGQSIRPVTK